MRIINTSYNIYCLKKRFQQIKYKNYCTDILFQLYYVISAGLIWFIVKFKITTIYQLLHFKSTIDQFARIKCNQSSIEIDA